MFVLRAKVQTENKKGHTALDIAHAYADPRVIVVVQKRWDEIPPPVDKNKKGKKKGNAIKIDTSTLFQFG
jgi:hypothetical protein